MAEAQHSHYSHLGIRDSPLGPRTYLLGTGLAVWELVKAHRALGEDVARTACHFEISRALVEEGLAYARLHQDEIEGAIRHHYQYLEHLDQTPASSQPAGE